MSVLGFFKDLTEISGIEMVLMFDNRNKLIDSWSTSRYNPKIFDELGETFWHVWGLMEYLKYDVNELSIPFDRGVIYGKTLPKLYLIIISRLTVEIPLIRLAVSVGVREMEESRRGKKKLKKLPDKKFHKIKANTLDEVEKIMLENILEE